MWNVECGMRACVCCLSTARQAVRRTVVRGRKGRGARGAGDEDDEDDEDDDVPGCAARHWDQPPPPLPLHPSINPSGLLLHSTVHAYSSTNRAIVHHTDVRHVLSIYAAVPVFT
jgi:hypothetical protein